MQKIKKGLIVGILFGQLLCQGVLIPGISMPFYLAFMILLAVITLLDWVKTSKWRIYKNQRTAIVLMLSIITIILSCLLNLFFPLDRIILVISSGFFCKACYDVAQCDEDRYWMINSFIAIILVSSLVEIGQFLGIDFCFELWSMTHQGDRILTTIAAERYMGLSPTILHFAYMVAAALTLTFFTKFGRFNTPKKVVLLVVFFVALMTNNTRSAIIAAIMGFAAWFLSSNRGTGKSIVTKIVIVGIIGVAMLMVSNYTSLFTQSRFGKNEGFDIRISMLLTGLNHMIHYPFGMGNYVVQSDLIVSIGNASTLYIQEVGTHNILCNVGASYGVLGLILLLSFYYQIFKEYRISKDKGIICVGVFWAIVGLFVNANFHNLYIYSGELITFMLIGILISYQHQDRYGYGE